MTTEHGPRLTDAQFFSEKIDTIRPGLEAIPDAVAAGDFALARQLFAADVRATLNPEHYFSALRDQKRRNPTYMYPDETKSRGCRAHPET